MLWNKNRSALLNLRCLVCCHNNFMSFIKKNNTIASMKTTILVIMLSTFFFASIYGSSTIAQSLSQDGPFLKKQLILSDFEDGHSYELTIPPHLSDLSAYLGISATIANTGPHPCRIQAFFNGRRNIGSTVYLNPGEMKTLEIVFKRMTEKDKTYFPAMNGLPGGSLSHWDAVHTNPATAEKVNFNISTRGKGSVVISNVKPFGKYENPESVASREGFFPFIDKFGQYKHDSWPGKVLSVAEMEKAIEKELHELSLIPSPEGRNQFGGWTEGPRLEPTGHFRTEKVDGKWWLVDPEGYLYWSHGFTGVRSGSATTRISEREHFFEELPSEDDPLYEFYGNNNFNFTAANLYRKYGEDWKQKNTINILKRIKSWGLNTIANWSDPDIYLYHKNRIPYTVAIHGSWPRIDGKDYKFPDVFDPRFRETLARSMQQSGEKTKDDPYCIGFFIENELSVSDLTRHLMNQPPKGFAKRAFIAHLKEKYGRVSKLNQSWGSSYASWPSLEKLTELPPQAENDCKEFDVVIADLFHSICREELKRVAPGKLYLGSRIHGNQIDFIKSAARYCDVVTFNRYEFTVEKLTLPREYDVPVMIGEFHFGALDRGHFHTGLQSVANQQQRADAYYYYVKGALTNPQIVGTHWFQYGDQAFTGRGDGENYQIGFVDITDNPYPEIIEAARKIGYQLYQIRAKGSE